MFNVPLRNQVFMVTNCIVHFLFPDFSDVNYFSNNMGFLPNRPNMKATQTSTIPTDGWFAVVTYDMAYDI
jgi:hypothetical protein